MSQRGENRTQVLKSQIPGGRTPSRTLYNVESPSVVTPLISGFNIVPGARGQIPLESAKSPRRYLELENVRFPNQKPPRWDVHLPGQKGFLYANFENRSLFFQLATARATDFARGWIQPRAKTVLRFVVFLFFSIFDQVFFQRERYRP